jgi:hypothetical protein
MLLSVFIINRSYQLQIKLRSKREYLKTRSFAPHNCFSKGIYPTVKEKIISSGNRIPLLKHYKQCYFLVKRKYSYGKEKLSSTHQRKTRSD